MWNGCDEQELRRRAREAMQAGLIPRERPTGLWGGHGSGERCAVCGHIVEPSEMELEIEFAAAEVNMQGAREFHMHLTCFAAWEFVRSGLE